jgi:hypothetical protein
MIAIPLALIAPLVIVFIGLLMGSVGLFLAGGFLAAVLLGAAVLRRL